MSRWMRDIFRGHLDDRWTMLFFAAVVIFKPDVGLFVIVAGRWVLCRHLVFFVGKQRVKRLVPSVVHWLRVAFHSGRCFRIKILRPVCVVQPWRQFFHLFGGWSWDWSGRVALNAGVHPALAPNVGVDRGRCERGGWGRPGPEPVGVVAVPLGHILVFRAPWHVSGRLDQGLQVWGRVVNVLHTLNF